MGGVGGSSAGDEGGEAAVTGTAGSVRLQEEWPGGSGQRQRAQHRGP